MVQDNTVKGGDYACIYTDKVANDMLDPHVTQHNLSAATILAISRLLSYSLTSHKMRMVICCQVL